MSQSQPAMNRRVSPVSIAVGILAAILFALLSAAGIYTDWLWFDQLGYEEVFLTQILGQVIAFAIGFVVMALLVSIGLALAGELDLSISSFRVNLLSRLPDTS